MIAFPGISTGIYGYPLPAAADVAVSTVLAELAAHPRPHTVILCTFGPEATAVMRAAIAAHGA